MKIKHFSKVVALPALMLGAMCANAASDGDAIQACSEAIAASIEKEQGADVKLHVDMSQSGRLRKLRTSTLIHLDAVDSATGSVVGRYDCVVNRRAVVRSLKVLAPDAPAAQARAVS